jgi:hypothetical protein
MILQIVAPLVASVGAAATLKQDLCVSPMAPSFFMAVADAIFLWGETGYRLHMAVMSNLIFLRG